jgi:hypothetical protein
MGASDWFSLAAVVLSIYGIYLSKKTKRQANDIEFFQRAGQALLSTTNAKLQFQSLAISIHAYMADPIISDEEREQLKEVLIGVKDLAADCDWLFGEFKSLWVFSNISSQDRVSLERCMSNAQVIDRKAAHLIAMYDVVKERAKQRNA